MAELRLTREQRKAFFASEWPELAGKGKPPVSTGHVHRLSSRLSFEVVRVHFKRGRWRLEYRVVDDREQRFYLVPMMTSLERMAKAPLGEDGLPVMGAPEEDIGYTRDPRRIRADNLRTVPPNVQNVIDMRAKLSDVEHDRAERTERENQRDVQRLNSELRELAKRATKMGLNAAEVMAPIAREIANAHEAMSEDRAA